MAPLLAAGAREAYMEITDNFVDAREQLEHEAFDLVVARLRLGPYNAIHLAYLALDHDPPPRVIVHGGTNDLALAREVQRAGAFFERTERLVMALPSYLRAHLPLRDRRDAMRSDRRRLNRGGRRACDRIHSLD